MKFKIERSAVLRSLAHVQSVVERRNTIPILSNIRLDAGSDGLRLIATDMDLEVIEDLAAGGEGAAVSVSTSGSTTVPAHTLYDIVRTLPDGADLEVDGSGTADTLHLRSGRSRFTLPCLPVSDFPVMAAGQLSHEFRLAAADLRSLIDRTRFAISTEETRYYLNGIYLHAATQGGVAMLRAVATDGHRLARFDLPLPDGAAGMPGVIIPRKTVAEARRLIEESAEEVTIALSETKIRFSLGAATLTSKLIDGTFPDYERVIPQNNDKRLKVDCARFTDAVKRVSAISSEKSRAVKVALDNGSLLLSASSPDQGSATEELDAVYDGEPMEIGFNSRYLIDITQQIDGEFAQFTMADPSSPTLLEEPGESSALYVLMPMRV